MHTIVYTKIWNISVVKKRFFIVLFDKEENTLRQDMSESLKQ